jgi:ligand-binding sensor domain-containing protein
MKHLLAALALVLVVQCSAQQLPYLKWSTNEGLAQSQVRCVYQDKLGYLWIGTLGGVSRFNGINFQNYSRRDGLISNQINTIADIGDSLLVFGAIGGITTYDGQQFQTHLLPERAQSAQVNDFCSDSRNQQTLIATEQGLFAYRDSLVSIYSADQLPDPNIKRVFFADDALILVTRTGVYKCASAGEPVEVLISPEDIEVVVLDGLSDGRGGFLLATLSRGVLHCTLNEIKGYGINEGLISDNITGIETGRDTGEFWLKSRDGFSRIQLNQSGEGANISAYGPTSGLDNVDIRAMLHDREGNLWLGTYGGGLRKFIDNGVSHFTTAQGIAGDIVMTILPEGRNQYWFGTYDNGISLWSANEVLNFGLSAGLLSTRVWCSSRDQIGQRWFGTSGGLSLWLDGQFVTFTTEDGLPHNQILSLAVDGEEGLYIGTARGLAYRNAQTGQIETLYTVPKVKVRCIRRQGNTVWLATNTGVIAYTDDQVSTVFDEAHGLPDNSVFSIEIGPDERIWAGTESGLVRFGADNEVEWLELEGGFGANHINFIVFDENDQLWLGTNDGLFIAKQPQDDQPKWERMGRHDGITFLETNQNAVHIDRELLWFGTSNALTRIALAERADSRKATDIRMSISELRINLEEAMLSKYGIQSSRYGVWPSNITVPHTDNHFSFFFDALSLRDPENLRYQYYLEGIDEEWEAITETKLASYSQLPFGSYIFHVRAVDPANEAGEEAQFSFTILPPFWLRWWFILLEIAAIFAVAAWIYQSRKRSFMAKMERQQLDYKSRMLALEQQTLNSSMNRHFIFNSLNAIQYYINRQDRLSANRYLSNFAKLIRKNLDSSQANFASLHEELERLTLYLQLEHMRFTDRFEYTIDIDDAIDTHSVQVPAMLLQPFLENSIWHGILPKEEVGHLQVKIEPHDATSFRVSIIDDGIGITTSLRNKGDQQDHISHGMTITSGRVELLQKMTGLKHQIIGPYELTDQLGHARGTRVDVILPLDLTKN